MCEIGVYCSVSGAPRLTPVCFVTLILWPVCSHGLADSHRAVCLIGLNLLLPSCVVYKRCHFVYYIVNTVLLTRILTDETAVYR